jgi:hypothetical protein
MRKLFINIPQQNMPASAMEAGHVSGFYRHQPRAQDKEVNIKTVINE